MNESLECHIDAKQDTAIEEGVFQGDHSLWWNNVIRRGVSIRYPLLLVGGKLSIKLVAVVEKLERLEHV